MSEIKQTTLEKTKSKRTKKILSTQELQLLIIDLIQDRKGKDIVSLDLTSIPEAITDYFIVCHGESTTQTRAIIDHIEEELTTTHKMRPLHIEGRSFGEWCLIDYGDVVVHVFQKEKREFYQLEDLWSDAVRKDYD